MNKHKLFSTIGWVLIAGGILGAIMSFWVINSQEFVVALLARIVEEPFAYRQMIAVLAAVIVAVFGGLFGLIYLGLAEVMRRSA